MAHRDGDYLLVAALDLGTTFSGYAFSLRTDPEKVICNNNWGEEYGFKVRLIQINTLFFAKKDNVYVQCL